jgi:hypothetical protein
MGKARLILNLMLTICGVASGCSTESAVQPNTMGAGAGTGSLTAGMTGAMVTAGTTGTSVAGTTGTAGAGAGTGVAGGESVDAGTPVLPDAGEPLVCMPGPTQGNTVLLIGDSYVDINAKAFGTELQRLAKAAGALGASDKYTDRSVSGTQLVGGLLQPSIPGQYMAENNSDGHVKTVVMDGGGNDVLLGDRNCITVQAPPASQHCVDTVAGTIAAAKTLMAQMASDGVEHVIYFFYPHLPGGGLGGTKALEDASVDYAIPLVQAACADAPLDCVFVDTRGLFGEAVADFQDGIHPTVPNIQKISAKVWDVMTQACIAQ